MKEHGSLRAILGGLSKPVQRFFFLRSVIVLSRGKSCASLHFQGNLKFLTNNPQIHESNVLQKNINSNNYFLEIRYERECHNLHNWKGSEEIIF